MHEHGVAEVGIAVDERSVQIEFRAPGSAVIGLERIPVSNVEQKRLKEGLDRFRANASHLFHFDPALGCSIRILKTALEDPSGHTHTGLDGNPHVPGTAPEHQHDHLDMRALVDVRCQKHLKGSVIRFDVNRHYAELSTLRVQVVGIDFQTGAELKGSRDSVRLSR